MVTDTIAEPAPVVETKPEVKEVVQDTSEKSILSQAAVEKETAPETPEAKVARLAEEDRILKADEKTLKPEEVTKRKELLEAKSNAIPENYEIKVPEGMKLDDNSLKELSPALKELKVTQGQLQGLIDKVYAPLIKKAVDTSHQESMTAWKNQVDGWKVESQKVLGSGEEGKQNLSILGKAVQTFGGEEFRKMVDETGLGNHPEFVKFALKVGKAISQDKFVDGDKTTNSPREMDLNKLYPTMAKK